MLYTVYGETDTGRVRSHNEDCIDWYLDSNGENALAILADGVGGTSGGAVASRLAVETIREQAVASMRNGASADTAAILGDAIRIANALILERREQSAELAQMATTIVAALASGDELVVAHIGDSRCYRLRGDCFEALTRDDTLREQMIDEGVITAMQTEGASFRHILTRTLGTRTETEPQLQHIRVEAGDVYLFCSDGLNGMLDDASIHDILKSAENNSRAASELIRNANAAGGDDNISVILLHCMQ